jgi:predicted ArsR family transcriptional regulator
MKDLRNAGLGETQSELLDRIKRRGEATVAELEGDTGLARETVRDHCKGLASQGLVERAGLRRHGPGRPQVVYRLAEDAELLFPRREGALLRELAEFLVEDGREDLLVRFFEGRTRARRASLEDRLSGLSGDARLREVARVLSEDGFVAEAEADAGGARRLRLCHCPLRDLVAVSHLPCRAEMDLVEDLVGEPLARESFMPHGGSSCTYRLAPEAGAEGPGAAASRPIHA